MSGPDVERFDVASRARRGMTDVHFRQWTVEDADGRTVDVIPVDDHEELVAQLRRGLAALEEQNEWLEAQLAEARR